MALRFMAGAEVDSLLMDSLLRDPASSVRRQAATAFGFRGASEEILRAHESALTTDGSEGVCLAALRNLVRWIPLHPELKEVIVGAENHPMEGIRKAAKAYRLQMDS